MHVSESPMSDKQIDHTMSGSARRLCQVRSGFNHHPRFRAAVGGHSIAGLHQRPCKRLVLVQAKAKRHIERAFNAVDTNFAIALRRMAVAATE